jgi:hypothetical protein
MNIGNIFLIISLVLLTIIVGYIVVLRILNLKTKVNEIIKDKIVLKILVPVKNDKKALAAEQFFQSLHGIIKGEEKSKDHYSFEIQATSQGIYFIVVCSKRYKSFIENQIYAQYPDAQINEIEDYTLLKTSKLYTNVELVLEKEFFLPIRTFMSFEVDPLASITGALANLKGDQEVWLQTLVRPIDNKWQEAGKKYIQQQKAPATTEVAAKPAEGDNSFAQSDIERKSSKVGLQFKIRILSLGSDKVACEQALEDIEAAYKQFQTAQQNSIIKPKKKKQNRLSKRLEKFRKDIKLLLIGKRLGDKLNPYQKFHQRYLDERETNIINIEELASIYHLPNESVKTPNIAWAKSRKLEFPLNIPVSPNSKGLEKGIGAPSSDARLFALTDYRNIHVPFGIKQIDRRRHMYLLGKTGTGKSTLLKNMIIGDILDGKGLAVLDPHGDLVEEILDIIPEDRIKDVVYLDPSDVEFPMGLNMLDIKPDETKDLLADGIVNVFKKFFGDSWGPRLEYILNYSVLTLLHCQNVSLLAVLRILSDKNYRKFLLKQVKDPFILKFWEDEFTNLSNNPKLLAEAIAPIQNKVGRFLGPTMIRNMIGQIKSSIDLQEIMNSGKIFLVNLSQGKIGEENSSLLGALIVTRLYSNAMQRAKIPEADRKDFYLYVDEFQNFATESFIKILSEARKYGLNLIVTHQYIDQIDEKIQNAIFGNVGTLMNYVVGQKDAQRLEREYAPQLTSEDLVNLDKFRLVMKLTIDLAQSQPFTAIGMKPTYTEFKLKERIKEYGRQTYAKPQAEVEQKLNKWASQEYDAKGNLVQGK